MSENANRTAGTPLTNVELACVSGGMINQYEGERPNRNAGNEGTTWVPAGTVKVYLAGVQVN
jgi:hypothetical protein